MTLSSQAPRAGASRQHMYRRRKRRRWPMVLLLLCFVGIIALLLFKQPKNAPNENSETARQNTVEPTTENPPGPSGVIEPDPLAPWLNIDPDPVAEPEASRPEIVTPGSQTPPEVVLPGGATARENTDPAPSEPSLPNPNNEDTAYALFRRGKDLVENQKLVEGRQVLSDLLFTHTAPISDALADDIRTELNRANQTLVFSPTFVDGDQLAVPYKVQSGDRLSRIAPRFGLTSKFVARMNGIDPNKIRVGQTLKLIQGPVHARVTKRRFVMDLYANDSAGQAVYLTSYRVGLGTDDSTPIGSWVIEPGRKAINPDWRDDRTGEYYAPNNPENPIGEFWLALKGTDAATSQRTGYGIHGTIEPDSIGTMQSRGCIRLRDGDIDEVFYTLVEGDSTVHILP